MKKIIKGKLYDTDTATPKGSTCSGGHCGDFTWMEEVLYEKRSGEFFLFGQGGPMSKYQNRVGINSWSGGEKIVPLTKQEAKTWAEENLNVEEYEEIFGPVEE